MLKLRTYSKKDLRGVKTIVMRIDANVDVSSGSGWFLGLGAKRFSRIEAMIPELLVLLKEGFNVVLLSHLGRPKGKKVNNLSLKVLSRYLGKRLRMEVHFEDSFNASIKQGLTVFENVRFHEGEIANSAAFAKKLASLGGVYINNAFSVSHRKHASMNAITRYLPSFAGKALKAEFDALTTSRKQPMALVLGGIKLDTKLPLLMAMEKEVDFLIIGSGVAAPFMKLDGYDIDLPGGIKITKEQIANAKKIRAIYGHRLILPGSLSAIQHGRTVEVDYEHAYGTIEDIGAESFRHYESIFELVKTVVWNGPMGLVEKRSASAGTIKLAKILRSNDKIHTIVGGGDTVNFLQRKKMLSGFNVVSNGGGAMLALLAGEKMPGLEAIK